jgi:hypothetical protein
MALKIHVNCDTQDLPRGSSGVDWVEVSTTNDKLIFSKGSDIVKDGEVIPTPTELNSAGIRILETDVEVPHFFLADFSVNELKEIFNMGNKNKQYILCFEFTGATASEPVLELWDDIDVDTIDFYCLGQGIASNSFFRGITTTDGLPGEDWTGNRLAGSAETRFLWLNNENGALSVAKDLYCNLRITVPANFSAAAAETPVIAIKYTTN